MIRESFEMKYQLEISAPALVKPVPRSLIWRAILPLLLIAVASPAARAQIKCDSGSAAANKLSCLIPSTVTPSGFTFDNSRAASGLLSNSFGFLTSDIGGEISQIPLASPASGVIFSIDPALKVPVPSDQSLGPILTQRADTIGRHKVYVASTYQYFLLEDVDGLSLKNLPSAFFYSSPGGTQADTLGIANGVVNLRIHQFVGYVTLGLTDHIDVSVAVPVLRVDMRYTFSEGLFNKNTSAQLSPCSETNPPPCGPGLIQSSKAEEATGIGDVVLAFKEEAWKGRHSGVAFGAELRLPTGDAQNFLGSGTFGLKPFVTFTRSGKLSPHFNVGYQFNGKTILVSDSSGGKATLPQRLLYSGGLDWGIAKRLTVAADVLEQRVFSGQRAIDATVQVPPSTLPVNTVLTGQSSYNRTDGSIGIKLKPFGNMIVTGNLLVKLDRNGLRQRLAPLMGLSFTY
jgi:hypothetical protein